jgi:aminoglycoside 6'-N-acetyltransferase I
MVKYRELNRTEDEIKAYHNMRCELYIKDLKHIQHSEEELYKEMLNILKGEGFYKNELLWIVFVAVNRADKFVGFVEITVYPELSFCESKPVGYVEAWYTDSDFRCQGIGRGLIKTAEEWLKHNKIKELASDVEIWNEISHKAHRAVGFAKTHEENGCVIYKKSLYD